MESAAGLAGGEGAASVAMTAPPRPTKKMIEDHEVSHLPFRSWCTACVRGRAKSCPRYRRDKSGEVYSTFSADYGFFGVPGEAPFEAVAGKDLPVIVAYDRKAKCPFAHPVPHKGLEKDGKMNLCPVRVLANDLNKLGYKKVNAKSDQESSIKAVIQKLKETWAGEIVIEMAPKGEKASNGEAERA
eukprot:9504012-Pyramimonas_sp.AAC.2